MLDVFRSTPAFPAKPLWEPIGVVRAGKRRAVGGEVKPTTAAPKRKSVRSELVFITRNGCVNTPDMFNNLDDALRSLKLALDYEVVNLGTLTKSDPRTGYPTPTVLYRGHDLFGMPEPTPPYPEPT